MEVFGAAERVWGEVTAQRADGAWSVHGADGTVRGLSADHAFESNGQIFWSRDFVYPRENFLSLPGAAD
jgi:hypothetical protein